MDPLQPCYKCRDKAECLPPATGPARGMDIWEGHSSTGMAGVMSCLAEV